ncbi:MAG: efflux RND transporter periplasmic adaptor subunit, partial [Spirochaetota bacterium]
VLMFLGIPAARFLTAPEPVADVEPPTPVVVGRPVLRDAERSVRYSGNLIPEASTTVLPKVGGRITAMEAETNQRLSAGDVIARIEDDVLRLQVAQARAAYEAADAQYRQAVRGVRSEELEIARADVEQAEATLETARANVARTERLFQAEAISRREYEAALDEFETAETQVANARRRLDIMEEGASEEELTMARANAEAAQRQLELAELQLDYAVVRAPVGGTVARVLAEEGQMVGRQTPLVALVNDNLIHARMSVPERLYGEFRGTEGAMTVRVYPEAYPESDPFVGTISTVASVIDAQSRTFEVEVAIPNADGRLRPGMYVNAVFVLETFPAAVHVPASAVQLRDGRGVVFGVRASDAERSPAVAVAIPVVSADGPDGTRIVHDGLAGDEQIIVEGATFLSDAGPVDVQ